LERSNIEDLSPLIPALDTPDLVEARRIGVAVRDRVDVVKVGLELFSTAGPEALELLKDDGFEIFLDLKMNDIPNTVASATTALCRYEPLFITVHTMGGQEMMRATVAAVRDHCERSGCRRPLLLGVTVLTSLDLLALKKIGIRDSVEGQVLRLARLAVESGMDGLVTSPLETLSVRRKVGREMVLVTPGVRLAGAGPDDQKRVATPGDAVKDGANFVVVGRQLCLASDPAAVALEILEDIGAG
jgi:orotidine-5'-phosphate decarboxylase